MGVDDEGVTTKTRISWAQPRVPAGNVRHEHGVYNGISDLTSFVPSSCEIDEKSNERTSGGKLYLHDAVLSDANGVIRRRRDEPMAAQTFVFATDVNANGRVPNRRAGCGACDIETVSFQTWEKKKSERTSSILPVTSRRVRSLLVVLGRNRCTGIGRRVLVVVRVDVPRDQIVQIGEKTRLLKA